MNTEGENSSRPGQAPSSKDDHVSESEKGHFGRGRKGINAIPRTALKLRLNTARRRAKMLCTPASWQLMRLAKNGLAPGALATGDGTGRGARLLRGLNPAGILFYFCDCLDFLKRLES